MAEAALQPAPPATPREVKSHPLGASPAGAQALGGMRGGTAYGAQVQVLAERGEGTTLKQALYPGKATGILNLSPIQEEDMSAENRR